MSAARCNDKRRHGGIRLHGAKLGSLRASSARVLAMLSSLGIADPVRATAYSEHGGWTIRLGLREDYLRRHFPDHDSLGLSARLGLAPSTSPDDLLREILLSMLAAPVPFEFPDADELFALVRVRRNIVENGRRTALAFHTEVADRPPGYWNYAEDRGFTLKPGSCLLSALKEATQPEASGRLYPFSCYRATEYVLLLSIAQELRDSHPELYRRLVRQWETRAITADGFRATFLREYGSLAEPLPLRYYVPGSRVWFRNPDDRSSDATGFEGSWVFYLGGGLFTNFWKRDRPFTLETKCVEVYHWRHGTYVDGAGELRIDESVVDNHVRATLEDPRKTERVLSAMLKLREPSGVYRDGGCVDASREHPRRLCAGTTDLRLPDADA